MEQKSKSIGTETYLVTQMDAIRALKIQTKLIKMLGSGALELMDTSKDTKEKIAGLVPKLMENFDDDLANELVLSLFEKGVFTKKGEHPKVVDFATHFAGKVFEMWKVVAFILEVNFNMGESIGSNSPTTDADLPKQKGS